MLEAISYFNPLANKHTFRHFKQMGVQQKIGTVVLTCLGAIVLSSLERRDCRIPRYVSLPAAGLCLLAIFRALVAFATRRNLSDEKKTEEPKSAQKEQISPAEKKPEPTVIQAENSSPAVAIPPIAPVKEKTGLEIQKEQCAARIQEKLGPNEYMGTAIDNGDCFYDAIAQLLVKQGIPATVQSLRNDIKEALKDPVWNEHLKAKVMEDPRGIGSFDDYVQNVSPKEGEEPKDPLWGDASREGVILCQKYRFNLRVLGADLLEPVINANEELKAKKKLKDQRLKEFEGQDNTKLEERFEKEIQAIRRELYKNPNVYYYSEDIYPKGVPPYPKTLTVALFCHHFRPVLTR